jgi:hypothetical protein
MTDEIERAGSGRQGRRSFLRDALTGAASVLAGSEVGSAAAPGDHGSPSPPSPPPEAAEVPPEEARQSLDRQQEEFARDNPGSTRYPSS